MKKTRTKPWDAADYLETGEDMAAYLEAAFEDGDPALIAAAPGDISAREVGPQMRLLRCGKHPAPDRAYRVPGARRQQPGLEPHARLRAVQPAQEQFVGARDELPLWDESRNRR